MSNNVIRTSMIFAMSMFTSIAMADTLASHNPYAAEPFGQQSDASTEAFSQIIVLPDDALVESVTWWGYHGGNSGGALYDSFVVTLDGTPVAGSLTVDDTNELFSQYTLHFTSMSSAATTLTVANNSLDVEWFWQSAANPDGSLDASSVAYRIEGSIAPVPEPAAILLTLPGLALVLMRLRRKALIT